MNPHFPPGPPPPQNPDNQPGQHFGPPQQHPGSQQFPPAPPPPPKSSGIPAWQRLFLGGVFVFAGLSQLANVRKAIWPAQAYVTCRATPPTGFSCNVEHRQGTSALHVCWDIVVTCQNGTRAVGHACHDVERHAPSVATVPESTFTNAAACDRSTAMALEHMVVTEQ